MENVQGKKPAEWFAQLKEPYKSQAIENINSECINSYCKSIMDALSYTFTWVYTPQGDKQWAKIYNSIEAGETTYLEPELIGNTDNLKPEQMESGKWYVIESIYLWLIKFKNINNQDVNVFKSICTDSVVKYKYEDFNQCKIEHIKSIRHATKEEVLKYFDEKFENVSLINEGNNTQVTEQQNESQPEKVETDWKAKFEEMFEKANYWHKRFEEVEAESQKEYTEMKRQLIDRNNELDAKFEELLNRYELLITEAHKLDVLSGEMCDKYTELQKDYDNLNFCYTRLMSIKEENDLAYEALDAKYSKLELQQNNQKVYFFSDTAGDVRIIGDLEYALEMSEEKERIYEAICIGKKKSILVNENS